MAIDMEAAMRGEKAWRSVMDALPDAKGELRDALIDLGNMVAWDDAVHISAPWEPHSTLCGNWNRNMVKLEDQRPNAMEGCWTCLGAADWFDKNMKVES